MGSKEYFAGNQEQLIESRDTGSKRDTVKGLLDEYNDLTSSLIVRAGSRSISMNEFLVRSREQGLSREPKKQDILVHPEWPWSLDAFANIRDTIRRGTKSVEGNSNSQAISQWLEAYRKHVQQIITNAEHLIVLPSLSAGDTSGIEYPRSAAIPSAASNGFLEPQQIVHMSEKQNGFSPADMEFIGGSALNRCIMDFILQRWMAKEMGIFFDQKDTDFVPMKFFFADDMRRTSPNMRLSTVFDVDDSFRTIQYSHRWLFDEHTLVIPSESQMEEAIKN